MDKGYCDCHMKHTKQLVDIEKDIEAAHTGHAEMWEAIKKKIDYRWLFALIPLLVALALPLASFQKETYDLMKEIDKKMALMELDVKHIKETIQ